MAKPIPLPTLKAAMDAKGLNVPALAKIVNRSSVQVWRVLHSQSRPSPELAIEMEKALSPHFTRTDARPDLWPREACA